MEVEKMTTIQLRKCERCGKERVHEIHYTYNGKMLIKKRYHCLVCFNDEVRRIV